MGQGVSSFGTKSRAARRRMPAAALLALVLAGTFLPRAEALALPGTMMELAEVLGAVHHLRTLCGTNEGQLWRNKMIEMMGAVRPSERERQQLIRHFNNAYHRYKNAYPHCTATAARQSDKLMRDGERLAEGLAASNHAR